MAAVAPRERQGRSRAVESRFDGDLRSRVKHAHSARRRMVHPASLLQAGDDADAFIPRRLLGDGERLVDLVCESLCFVERVSDSLRMPVRFSALPRPGC